MSIVKYFNFIYVIYHHLFSSFVNLLKLFVKPDDSLILFNSFGGKKYDDSPKEIFELMRKDSRFKDYKFVWAFHEPEKFDVTGAKIIKTDNLNYFITALKSRCWITNSSVERGLSFKGKNTYYFNTWHGTPLKKMGSDISSDNKSFSMKGDSIIDTMTAQSDFEADIFSRVFGIDRSKFLMCGLPRNDKLANYTEDERRTIREKLNIPQEKKVILYAPTFREYERDSKLNCVLKPPMNIKLWEKELKEDFCLLFRAHYEVGKVMQIEENDFIKNMTDYPSLSELIIASDILVSDYSSIIFDYCVMDKAVYLFCYDYDLYEDKRGMYFDIRNYFQNGINENEVIELLKNMDKEKELIRIKDFREKYLNYYGNATKISLDCIHNNLKST